MAPSPQLVQMYKQLQQTFMSGNLQQTGLLLAKLKVRLFAIVSATVLGLPLLWLL